MAKSSELEQDDLYKIRHSAAHVMAQAVLELYPEARFGSIAGDGLVLRRCLYRRRRIGAAL
jgi:threonyl-tRNA synthetase